MSIDQYIAEIQKELDAAVIDVYRLEGALAMLRKIKAESERPLEEEKQEIEK